MTPNRYWGTLTLMSGGASDNQWIRLSGYASIGAGALHAVAVGLHAGHADLVRLFLVLAFLQIVWGLQAQNIKSKFFLSVGCVLHLSAVAGWILTRTVGVSFIAGLENAESPGPVDTVCAVLALIAFLAICMSPLFSHRERSGKFLINSAYFLAALALAGVWNVKEHSHVHGNIELTNNGLIIDSNGVIISPSTSVTASSVVSPLEATPTTAITSVIGSGEKSNKTRATTTVPTTTSSSTTVPHSHDLTTAQAQALASGWPRAFDPSQPIDFSGVGGVTAIQAERATALIQNTARDLARYANYNDAIANGYVSIGDSGFEHLVKYSYMNDGRFLDTSAPESLVYKVANGQKTLVSAMFIANPGTQVNDATINDYAGGLIQWHVHNNLCWKLVGGIPKVVGVLDAAGKCPDGSVLQTGGAPMVHVWITAHPCGPFAAVEGVAAGISNVPDSQRVDLCNAAH